jgi:hypothetical protein
MCGTFPAGFSQRKQQKTPADAISAVVFMHGKRGYMGFISIDKSRSFQGSFYDRRIFCGGNKTP